MNGSTVRRLTMTSALAALLFLGVSSAASAQSFISPFIGYDFSGDSGCPEISDCEDKAINFGVSFGSIGKVFGAELEFGYIDSFFGETPGISSNVLTLMGNIMLAPKFGPVQPVRALRAWSDQDPRRDLGSRIARDRQQRFRLGHRGRNHRVFQPARGSARRRPILPRIRGAGHPWTQSRRSQARLWPYQRRHGLQVLTLRLIPRARIRHAPVRNGPCH